MQWFDIFTNPISHIHIPEIIFLFGNEQFIGVEMGIDAGELGALEATIIGIIGLILW